MTHSQPLSSASSNAPAGTARWEGAAGVALGLSLGLPLLHLLPAACMDPARQRMLLAVLLGGLLYCFVLEKCGAHRRFPAGALAAARGSRDLSFLAAFIDGALITCVFNASPAAGVLAAALRLFHGAAPLPAWTNPLRVAAPMMAGAFAASVVHPGPNLLPVACVLASSKLLYVAVGELVPHMHRMVSLRPAQQLARIAVGITACAILPAARFFD
jgi:hypothetical protein